VTGLGRSPRAATAPRHRSSALARVGTALWVLLWCAAPVPGDIGGCAEPAAPLDAALFFEEKWRIDCERCVACGLETLRCRAACGEGESVELPAFVEGCLPLSQDGEVCLRALEADDCDAYRGYMDDARPSLPTECDFCPEERRP